MALTTNSAPAYAAIQSQAFDDRTEVLKTRRLANREAMMKLESSMAASGQKINSVEDYTTLMMNTLGPSAFLSSGSPTVEGVNAILASQNAAAATAQEKARRDQFKVDADERKTVEQTIKERFANGDDAISVLEQAQKLYGQESVQKLQPDFKRMQFDAEREAVTKGLQYGTSMFGDTDDFNDFKSSNPYVPKHELAGMQKAAENKEAKRSADIEGIASAIGATGPITSEAAEYEIRAKILPLFGQNAKADKVEKAVKSAVSIALAASQRQSVMAQQKINDAGRLGVVNNFAANQDRIYQLEEADVKQRDLMAAQRIAQGKSTRDNQLAVVEGVFKGKKTLSDREMLVKTELTATLGSSVFTGNDASAYTNAVLSGDKREIAKIKGRAIPLDQYNEQVESTARILTGAHKFANINEAGATLTRLGMTTMDIASIGKELAIHQATVAKAGPTSVGPAPLSDFERAYQAETGKPYRRGDNGIKSLSDETTEVARLTADGLLKGFKTNVSGFIADAIDALAQNGSVSATQQELTDLAKRLTSERVAALVSGMGLKKEEADRRAAEITTDILNMTPPRAPIVKKVSRADAYRQTLYQQEQGLRVQGGFIGRAAQTYPSAGQGEWSPADF